MLHFLSGFPRSGSTLLANILAQCPRNYVTPTNSLVELLIGIRNSWQEFDGFRAQGLGIVKPRVMGAMAGLLRGFYSKELSYGRDVFDKTTGGAWIAYIDLLEQVFERPVKIIVTIRDLRDIVASFEKLHRANPMTRRGDSIGGESYIDLQDVFGRANQLLSKGTILGLSIRRLLDAFDRGYADRIILVPYNRLTNDPQGTLDTIHDKLEVSRFTYDSMNVEQVTHEDDSVHGLPLHNIRRQVTPETNPSWYGILPPQLADQIDREYSIIQRCANVVPT